MDLIEAYREVKDAPSWQRGVVLMEILHTLGESRENYTNFVGSDEETTFLSEFNVQRFIKFVKGRDKMDQGYYWVMETEQEGWKVGYYEPNEGFAFAGELYTIPLKEVEKIDLTPITREAE